MDRQFTNEAFVARIEPEYNAFMKRAETVRWSPATIDYSKIDHSKLTINDLFGVFVTLHIENYSDVYTKLLVEEYGDVPLIKDFVLNWEREEENHARVFEKYMISLGIPLDELRANYAKVNKDDFPVPTRDQAGLNVFVFLQELFTREMYIKILKATKEPVLTEILKRVVRDEERHYRFYKFTLGLRLEMDKKNTLKQMRNVMRIFGMPQTMYRQRAMTDKLMEYYSFNWAEIMSIARPIMKTLEASPSRLFTKLPRLQAAWQNRRTFTYALQTPYLWNHVAVGIKHALGFNLVPANDRKYVDDTVARLEKLLTPQSTSDNVLRFKTAKQMY